MFVRLRRDYTNILLKNELLITRGREKGLIKGVLGLNTCLDRILTVKHVLLIHGRGLNVRLYALEGITQMFYCERF